MVYLRWSSMKHCSNSPKTLWLWLGSGWSRHWCRRQYMSPCTTRSMLVPILASLFAAQFKSYQLSGPFVSCCYCRRSANVLVFWEPRTPDIYFEFGWVRVPWGHETAWPTDYTRRIACVRTVCHVEMRTAQWAEILKFSGYYFAPKFTCKKMWSKTVGVFLAKKTMSM